MSYWSICTWHNELDDSNLFLYYVSNSFVSVAGLNFSNDYSNQDSDLTKSGTSKNDNKELQDKDKELQDNDKELQANDKELQDKNEEPVQDQDKKLQDKDKELQDKDKELQDQDKIASPESPPLPNTPLQINTSIDSTEPIAVLVMACNRVSVSKCIDTLLRYVHVCSGFIYRKFS